MKIVQDYKQFTKNKKFINKIATILFNACFHSVLNFRISHFFYKMHLPIIAKIIWYYNRILYNVDIDYRADLAGGFVLVHGLGVVIGKSVKSEGNLTVYQGVTIGGTNGKKRVDENGKEWTMPYFEKDVVLYTNSMIFGPVVISENTIVKAGTLVSKDI